MRRSMLFWRVAWLKAPTHGVPITNQRMIRGGKMADLALLMILPRSEPVWRSSGSGASKSLWDRKFGKDSDDPITSDRSRHPPGRLRDLRSAAKQELCNAPTSDRSPKL